MAQVLLSLSILLVLVQGVHAGCSVSTGCREESDWDPSAFLNSDEVPGMSMPDVRPGMTAGSFAVLTGDEARSNENESAGAADLLTSPDYRSDQFVNGRMLKPLLSISSSDVVLDASSGSSYDRSHIKGAIHLPAKSFLNDSGSLRSAQEMASILGHAGISRDEPVVVYCDSPASGDATFVLWVLRYLGHDDARLLDGSLDDYAAAGLPVESSRESLPEADFIPEIRQDLLAGHAMIEEGTAQVVYAGTLEDFSMNKVPGSTFIDPSRITDGGRLMGSESLNETFGRFDRHRPVVIYSGDVMRASLIWYALQLMGFDSRLYTRQAYQPSISLGIRPSAVKKLGYTAQS
ncbi:MAG TPA: rhodanese-like domain-containing protein [Methanotrichaceae archaeon]|nr:rhodanese-like domain-containing protein [Methanotrichaceae archaeon]